jgi:hypothetical protein
MSLFRRSRRADGRSAVQSPAPRSPVIESLESRDYLSSTLIVTVPGPLHASAVSGVVVNERIAVDIANNGPDRFRGPLTITLFASTDQTLSDDDAQVAQRPLGAGFVIAAGRHRTLVVNVHAFPLNLDNNYFILGEVTPDGALGASNSTIQILPKRIDFSAAVPTIHHNGLVGHRLPVTVDVTNDGNVLARGNLAVNFGESTDMSGSSPANLATLSKHISIRPGKTQVLHFLVTLPLGIPTGNQFIVANVDPMDVYNDPNLLNNIGVSGSPITVT